MVYKPVQNLCKHIAYKKNIKIAANIKAFFRKISLIC
jgi:hypothetical protein